MTERHTSHESESDKLKDQLRMKKEIEIQKVSDWINNSFYIYRQDGDITLLIANIESLVGTLKFLARV